MSQGRNRKDNKSKQSAGGSRAYSSRGERPASASQSRRAAGTSQRSTGASRAAERKQERERERRRRQLITIGAILVGFIVLAAIVVLIVSSPAEAPIPEASLSRYEGITVTRTQEGYPLLGDPNAPVRAAVYSSFDCPHCRTFHDETMDAIVERVRGGNLAFIFVPLYGTGNVTNGQGAARAALCAADQGRFWQFHDALFDWQGRYANQAFTNNRITSGIEALNLDRSAFDACVRSGDRPTTILNAAQAEARGLLNFFGTPTVTINGVVPVGEDQQPVSGSEAILAAIDRAIATLGRGATDEPAAVATAEATDEAAIDATPEVAPAEEEQPEATPEATEAG